MTSAKKGSQSDDKAELMERRHAQAAELNTIVSELKGRRQKNRELRRRLEYLDSVSFGLYEEVDKLARKGAAEPITDLVLQQANEVIREAKAIGALDPYIARLSEFVAAGDNPQHRDAVVILRQVRQGLERLEKVFQTQNIQLDRLLTEAEGVLLALQLFLQTSRRVAKVTLKQYNVELPAMWLAGSYEDRHFDTDQLDAQDLTEYFVNDDDE